MLTHVVFLFDRCSFIFPEGRRNSEERAGDLDEGPVLPLQ